MASNKVMVCPICGAGKKFIYTNANGYYKGRTFCAICNKEIIPLPTPQEEKHD